MWRKITLQFKVVPHQCDANYITPRKGPERDRELDNILGNIRKAPEVGVKIITYHWTVIPVEGSPAAG